MVRVLVLTLLAVWKCMCKWLSYIQREDILKTTYESQRIASNFTSFFKKKGNPKKKPIIFWNNNKMLDSPLNSPMNNRMPLSVRSVDSGYHEPLSVRSVDLGKKN